MGQEEPCRAECPSFGGCPRLAEATRVLRAKPRQNWPSPETAGLSLASLGISTYVRPGFSASAVHGARDRDRDTS